MKAPTNTETIWTSKEERDAVLLAEWQERERIECEARESWQDQLLQDQRQKE